MLRARADGQVELLVLQPTPFCNINCSYCYLPNRSDARRMSVEVLELIGARILAENHASPDLTVVWHAGEPLVLGPAWYEQAFSILARHCPAQVRLTHSIQTNGTLINSAWAHLFREHDVGVGVSLDGPQHLHDARRRGRDGKGTFGRTMRGVHTLQAEDVPFHVISVLSTDSLRCPDEMFDFFVSEGIDRICFNIEEVEAANATSSLQHADADQAFRAFFIRFMERMAGHDKPMWVRELGDAVGTILTPRHHALVNPQVEPLRMLTVDALGNLSTFSPELIGTPAAQYGDFRFANLREGGVAAMLASDAFQRAYADITDGIEACRRSCAWFRWCRGGAPANKLFENGSFSSTETLYCRLTKKAVLDVVLAAIETGTLPGMGRRHVASSFGPVEVRSQHSTRNDSVSPYVV